MQKRTHEIKLRVTEEEFLLIKSGSKKPKIAEWIRELVLNQIIGKDIFFNKKKKQVKELKIDPILLRTLVGIGNNLNQLARHTNKTGDLIKLTELALIKKEIEQIRQVLSDS